MNSSRTLAVFDLDGTISRRDTFTPYVFGWLARHPSRWWRLIFMLPTLLAYALGRADRGHLKGQLLHQTLGGLPHDVMQQWTARHVHQLLQHGLFANALERIRWHREAGHYLVLMSASVDCFVPAIGSALGFDETICSQARWNSDGTLDGRLIGANCRGEEKLRQLRNLKARLAPGEIWAYGNSRADLIHMREATHGVYVNGPSRDLSSALRHIVNEHWS
jgi:phosphatidylglycerophosphatase C